MDAAEIRPVSDDAGREPAEQPAVNSFDPAYARLAGSPTLKRIMRSVYGTEYPEEAHPFGFVTLSELRRIAQLLGVGPGQRFVDLGCGEGGLSLWVARATGAEVLGIDTSGLAIGLAKAEAQRLGLAQRAEFRIADAMDSGLPSASFDGVMSTDVLQLLPSPAAGVAEAARLLRQGGVFAFTTWCISEPFDGRARVPDYRPLLEEAGFAVESYEEPQGWRERQLAVFRLMCEQAAALEDELGTELWPFLSREARERPSHMVAMRRILACARRR
ncbi:MAG TPA: class I SAM-dependent methyltransferase [Roseiflexaceae bacterium]|nr:class I SAM-dependent methyltransferase [Roseiflexaceae bacterium]